MERQILQLRIGLNLYSYPAAVELDEMEFEDRHREWDGLSALCRELECAILNSDADLKELKAAHSTLRVARVRCGRLWDSLWSDLQ